jgi:hypothetical protein
LFDDGIFTGVYRNTTLKGAYTFALDAGIDNWSQSGDHQEIDPGYKSPRFMRELRVSAAVGDPTDVVTDPEDDVPGTGPGACEQCEQCEQCAKVYNLLIIIGLLLLIAIFLILWCCKRRG